MMWAIQKEIKDAYPKKVCHMPTRHVKEKKDSPHPKEIKEREMVHEKEFIHHPPKKKKKYISPHTCTS